MSVANEAIMTKTIRFHYKTGGKNKLNAHLIQSKVNQTLLIKQDTIQTLVKNWYWYINWYIMFPPAAQAPVVRNAKRQQ